MTGYNQYAGGKLTPTQAAQMATMVANGKHTKLQVAKAFGISLSTVYRILRREDRPIPPRAKCGTNSGYMAHKKKKENPCIRCRSAHSRVNTEYDKKYRKDRAMTEYCLNCGNQIKIAIRKGGGSCSNNCDKALNRIPGSAYVKPKEASTDEAQ